ncbi:hypothetical protein BGZ58_005008, partial [Dissophora ornata]
QSSSRGAGAITQGSECVDSNGPGILSAKTVSQIGNCSGGRPRLASDIRHGQQLDYIEAHINLDEYHIWRENEEFFKSKKDERSNGDILKNEMPYNSEKI